jgi:AmiR/NasT family two-component response regulator
MRIMVVDDEPIIRMDLIEILIDHHCIVVGEASDGETAIHLAKALRPEVTLMDIKMPGNINGMQAAKVLIDEEICPVVLLTAFNQEELVEESSTIGVFGYLVKPIREEDIFPALKVAKSRWNSLQRLKEENAKLKNKLEQRKIIERATGILMDHYDMKEHEAYRKIQRLSMDKRLAMVDVAKSIILSQEMACI